jgi:hypothetical protein
MLCPKCSFEQADGSLQCLRCGVIFAKLHPQKDVPTAVPADADALFESLGEAHQDQGNAALMGNILVWLVLLVWGVKFMLTPVTGEGFNQSWMHLINLPFHEAGHVIFTPLGRFLQVLGGTLGQWLAPAAVFFSFLSRGDRFAACVGLWWLGQSFMDIAPYMDDARAGQLMLLGGVTGSEVEDYHDWEIILTRLGLMQYDHLIARISFSCGVLLMTAALGYSGWVLYRQSATRRKV